MRWAYLHCLMVTLCCLLSFQACAEQPTTETTRRVALVIGNSAYEHTSLLPNPKNDALAITSKLKRLGFEVVGGVDLPRSKFERLVVQFARKIRQADVGLFFYAGHGMQVSGENYLVPVDAALTDEADLQFSMVKLTDILSQMERSTKTNLIFIDACRDNPLARTLARSMGRTRSGSIGSGLAPVKSGIGTMITFATEPGNVAQDGDGQNSPFTTALLRHIETPGLDIAPLLRNVRRDVIKATRGQQVPWNHSSLTNDFFFRPRVHVAALQSPATQNRKTGYTPVAFDGRIGKLVVENTSLYPIKVTLWHPQAASSAFRTWTIKGRAKVYLTLKKAVFSIGNDWGVQLGDSAIKPVGSAAQWRDNQWTVSPATFFR